MTDPMDENWDAALEGMRRISDMLTGFVTVLVNEGWSDEQARAIVVASFLAQKPAP